MSRVARIVVPGFPHHIIQYGNRKMDVFETDEDRLAYLRLLKKYAAQCNLSALLVQPDEESVTDYIRQQTQTGRPCGNETLLDKVEVLLSRTLRHKKPGRKPKHQQQKVQDNSENT